MGDKRYQAPELFPQEELRRIPDEERHTATFWLPVGIAAGLMAAIAWVFLSISVPPSKMQTSDIGAGQQQSESNTN